MNSNEKKAFQLGMPFGTANSKLHKALLFSLIKRLDLNYCFQCGVEIESKDTMSVEHKIPYLDSEDPIGLFFDLDNIAFSHLTCNIGAARNTKTIVHPSEYSYKKGCRCTDCKEVQRKKIERQRYTRVCWNVDNSALDTEAK